VGADKIWKTWVNFYKKIVCFCRQLKFYNNLEWKAACIENPKLDPLFNETGPYSQYLIQTEAEYTRFVVFYDSTKLIKLIAKFIIEEQIFHNSSLLNKMKMKIKSIEKLYKFKKNHCLLFVIGLIVDNIGFE